MHWRDPFIFAGKEMLVQHFQLGMVVDESFACGKHRVAGVLHQSPQRDLWTWMLTLIRMEGIVMMICVFVHVWQMTDRTRRNWFRKLFDQTCCEATPTRYAQYSGSSSTLRGLFQLSKWCSCKILLFEVSALKVLVVCSQRNSLHKATTVA